MKNKFWFVTLAIVMILGLALTSCKPAAEEAAPAAEEEAAPAAEEEAAPAAEEEAAPAAEEEAAPAEEEAAASDEETTITYIATDGYYTLDIYQTPWFNLTQSVMYDALVTLNLEKSEYIGVLADSWDISEDGLTITFYLKEGVTFHDGTPWNAEAAKWNLDKYLDPEWPHEINDSWAGNYVDSFEVVDDYTLQVNLLTPYAAFFSDLYLTYFVSPTAYEALGQDEYGLSPVGTGAFIPVEVVPNDHVLYAANPDYTWGAEYYAGEPPKVDYFEIKYIPDQAVAYAALETGEATFIGLPAQFLPTAETNTDISLSKGVSTELDYLGINHTKEPYNIKEFRQAIAYALDEEEIILAAFEGEAFTTQQFVPAGTPGYTEEYEQYAADTYPFDPAMANQILDDMGWVDTNGDGIREKDGEEMVYPFNFFTDEATGRAAEVIQGQLLDIGIMLELGPMEAAAQAEMLVNKNQDFFIRGYGYPDPVIVSIMVGPGNRNAYEDETASELAMAADTAMDPEARQAAVDALNKYLIDEAAWFPIWTPYTYIAYRSNVEGILFDVSGDIFFYDAYFAE